MSCAQQLEEEKHLEFGIGDIGVECKRKCRSIYIKHLHSLRFDSPSSESDSSGDGGVTLGSPYPMQIGDQLLTARLEAKRRRPARDVLLLPPEMTSAGKARADCETVTSNNKLECETGGSARELECESDRERDERA